MHDDTPEFDASGARDPEPAFDAVLNRFFDKVIGAARETVAQLSAVPELIPELALRLEDDGLEYVVPLDPCDRAGLPPLMACCVRLRYFLENDEEEIACLLEVPVDVVRAALRDAATWLLEAAPQPDAGLLAMVLTSRPQNWRWQ